MTQSDRESVVRTFVRQTEHQAKKSKSAIEAMQEALAISEGKRKKLSEACEASNMRLHNALAKQKRLEEENQLLAQRVHQLTDELQASREQADQLLRQAREESQREWTKKEAMFKNTIHRLKKDLRAEKQRNATSENSNTTNTTSTGDKESECRTLQVVPPPVRVGNTVIRPFRGAPRAVGNRSNLSSSSSSTKPNENTHSSRAIVAVPPPPPPTQIECKENASKATVPPPPPAPPATQGILKPRTVFGNGQSRSNSQPAVGKVKVTVRKQPQKAEESPLPAGVRVAKDQNARPLDAFKGKTPSKNRAEFVRGNGGIQGLKDKIRQVRSPTFK